jgi:hypothetical protein
VRAFKYNSVEKYLILKTKEMGGYSGIVSRTGLRMGTDDDGRARRQMQTKRGVLTSFLVLANRLHLSAVHDARFAGITLKKPAISHERC